MIAILVMLPVTVAIRIRKQGLPLINSLPVIESLIMRKWLVKTEHMNGAGHVFMDETHQLVISDLRKSDLEDSSLHQRRSGQARRAIEGSRTCGKPWAPICESGPDLVGCQE